MTHKAQHAILRFAKHKAGPAGALEADVYKRQGLVYLVDYQRPENNRFTAVNQWTVVENSAKRADVVLFLSLIHI